jgi:hypothetical protein
MGLAAWGSAGARTPSVVSRRAARLVATPDRLAASCPRPPTQRARPGHRPRPPHRRPRGLSCVFESPQQSCIPGEDAVLFGCVEDCNSNCLTCGKECTTTLDTCRATCAKSAPKDGPGPRGTAACELSCATTTGQCLDRCVTRRDRCKTGDCAQVAVDASDETTLHEAEQRTGPLPRGPGNVSTDEYAKTSALVNQNASADEFAKHSRRSEFVRLQLVSKFAWDFFTEHLVQWAASSSIAVARIEYDKT